MTAVTQPSHAATTTLLDALATTVAAQPDAIAVRTLDGSAQYTWSELDRQARRFAAGLRELGVGAGDTVGVMLTNDLPFYVADLGIVLFLGVFQLGLSYALFQVGLRQTPAVEASLLVLLEPVLNPIWTFLLAGERPGPWAMAGAVIILLATAWRTIAGARAAARPVTSATLES